MAYSSRAPMLQPAAPPPPPPPRSWQLPPPHHHDTSPTLTLSLALPSCPLVRALSPRTPHARRPRQDGGGGASAFARVRSSPTGDPPPCTECGKTFPSWKALFGHMRCHPERQWRGIKPPPLAVKDEDQYTVQEREVAAGLLMLASAGNGKQKSIVATSNAKESGGTSTPSPTAPAPPPRCGAGEHKCSVCDRGFATVQALGRHKRCHRERACPEVEAVAAPASNCRASPVPEGPATTLLDLNLPPPGTTMPLPWKSNQGGSLNALLDLKLGY